MSTAAHARLADLYAQGGDAQLVAWDLAVELGVSLSLSKCPSLPPWLSGSGSRSRSGSGSG